MFVTVPVEILVAVPLESCDAVAESWCQGETATVAGSSIAEVRTGTVPGIGVASLSRSSRATRARADGNCERGKGISGLLPSWELCPDMLPQSDDRKTRKIQKRWIPVFIVLCLIEMNRKQAVERTGQAVGGE